MHHVSAKDTDDDDHETTDEQHDCIYINKRVHWGAMGGTPSGVASNQRTGGHHHGVKPGPARVFDNSTASTSAGSDNSTQRRQCVGRISHTHDARQSEWRCPPPRPPRPSTRSHKAPIISAAGINTGDTDNAWHAACA
jgi:hypothetical protein